MLLGVLALALLQSPAPVQGLRHAVFDGYQRLFPLERLSYPVTIVVIDEPSLARYGQWPWPRTRMGELIQKIADAKPAAIGLDLFFPEPDRFSPETLAAELPGAPEEFTKWLRTRRGNDELFAETIAGKRVVLGLGAGDVDPRFRNPPRGNPVRIAGGVSLQPYAGHIGSLDVIDRAAAGRGLINSGPPDQVVRKVPYAVMVQGVVVPSLGIETLRVALGSPPISLKREGPYARLGFGEVSQLLQVDGTAWLRMGPHDDDRFVSAHDVFSGVARPESMRDKIVLVGTTALGLLDFKTTPLGQFVPGVEIHAQIVENLYNGVWLVRPDDAALYEAIALVVCGLIVILWIPRLTALEGVNAVAGLLVLLVGAGVLAFRHYGLLLDPVWPGIGTLAVFGTVVVGTLSIAERQRRQLRDQAARMAGEMDAARRIQMGLLPDPAETEAGDARLQLAALLEPARTVGGDFYDCFRIDKDRIFIVAGDVSGKGLPAALFMASVKSQVKNMALRGGDVGGSLSAAQREIAHENPEQLFVTAFAAVFDAAWGELTFANAGHEPPFTRAPGGEPKRLVGPGGPPLGALDDFEYPTVRYQMQPGEWLCVVTDGATEAVNRRKEFFGTASVGAALGAMPQETEPAEVIRRLRAEVAAFADGAEAADDLTLLVLRWRGNAAP
jgi:serine phosphatase RsbU (regulator of sigma subunit)/CHASE2 domain-containing sensor protein